jgi:hypothetical protein
MRSQTSLEATIPAVHTTDDEAARRREGTNMMWMDQEISHARTVHQPRRKAQTSEAKIPRHEQDEDRWRFERPIPGRDPVTEERGMGA